MKLDNLITLLEGFQANGITEVPSIKYSDETNILEMIYIKENSKTFEILTLTEDERTCASSYRNGIWACEECAYKDECILESEYEKNEVK